MAVIPSFRLHLTFLLKIRVFVFLEGLLIQDSDLFVLRTDCVVSYLLVQTDSYACVNAYSMYRGSNAQMIVLWRRPVG